MNAQQLLLQRLVNERDRAQAEVYRLVTAMEFARKDVEFWKTLEEQRMREIGELRGIIEALRGQKKVSA